MRTPRQTGGSAVLEEPASVLEVCRHARGVLRAGRRDEHHGDARHERTLTTKHDGSDGTHRQQFPLEQHFRDSPVEQLLVLRMRTYTHAFKAHVKEPANLLSSVAGEDCLSGLSPNSN